MPPVIFILMPVLALVIGLLIAWRRSGINTTWRQRHKHSTFSLAAFAICWVLFCISNIVDPRPFWPREAFGLLCFTVVLGCLCLSWQQTKRKAEAESLPSAEPSNHPPPSFLWQAVLILLPVVIMTGVGLIALVRDRAAVESEARQRADELIQQLQDNFGRRVASELSMIGIFSYQWHQHQRSARGGWPGSSARSGWEAASTNYPSLVAEWQRKFPGIEPREVLPNNITFNVAGQLHGNVPIGKSPPEPPDWLESLAPEQRAAWQILNEARAETDLSVLSNRVVAFLATDPATDAKVIARFMLLREECRAQDAEKAIANLRRLKWDERRVPSASGLPLGALAFAEMLHRAKETGPTEELWHELGDHVQEFPNFLTPLLLDHMESLMETNDLLQDGVAAWRTLWQSGERARGIAEAIQRSGKLRGITTTNLWIEQDGLSWFCILQPNQSKTFTSSNGVPVEYTTEITQAEFYAQRLVEHAFANALREPKPFKPEYFGYSVQLEGKPLSLPSLFGAPAMAPASDVLAVGEFHMWQPGKLLLQHPQPGQQPEFGPEFETLPSHPRFVLRVHLADRARLFAAYRQRLLLFGGLILVSAAAAIVGVLMARRAFLREQRLNDMKSNFVSSVSHELRAPIASVRLMAESLERGKISGPEKQHEYFRFIGQECRRLSALIENVLDFSRIDQGRKQYELEPTDVVALVAQTVTLMEPYATERGVHLKRQIPNEKLEHDLDGRAIQQALVNLIDNAIKHSPKGEVVSIELNQVTRQNPRGAAIMLSVADHGPGVPASEHERIFERFYRLGSELRRETQGVGIGLSIVKHIVEAHGGCVRLDSEAGKGSRFTIELPRSTHEQTGGTEVKL